MSDYATRYLGREVTVEIDRPLGTAHPKHGWKYPVNYGFVPGTAAPDGEGVDAYVLCVDVPVAEFRGRCAAVIRRSDDDDDKLVVVPEGVAVSERDIRAATDFQERFFCSAVVFPPK